MSGVAQWMRGLPTGVVAAIKGAFDYPNSVNLTVTTATQVGAIAMPRDFNVYTTVSTAGAGALLPWGVDQIPTANAAISGSNTGAQALSGLVEIGDTITAVNRTATSMNVYPQTGGTIQGGAANAGFAVGANKVAHFYYVGAGNWVANLSA